MKTDSKLKKYIIWGLAVSSIAIYRLFIFFMYSIHTTDIDQVVLWLYTAAAGHFDYLWPYFPGQMYGSGLEAILAVPFYWLGMPVYMGLPLTTIILWAIPFLLSSFILLKKNKYISSYLILLVFILSTIQVDILSSIPRIFIAGFATAFIGAIILHEYSKNSKAIFVAIILFFIAYLNSQISITISLISALYWVLDNYKELKKYLSAIISSVCIGSLLIFNFAFLFPRNHEYEIVYAVGTDSVVNINAIKSNLGMIGKTLSDYSIVSFFNIPIMLIAIFVSLFVVSIIKKEYKCFVVSLCSVIGTLCFFALTRTLAYTDLYLFKQSRMFVFIPFLIILNIFIYSHTISLKFKMNHYILVIGIVVASIVKIIYFNNIHTEYVEEGFDIESYAISIDTMKEFSSYIHDVAKENNARYLMIHSDHDASALRYTTEALNYGDIEVYTNKMDRFLNEEKLHKQIDGNILVLNIDEDQNTDLQVYPFTGTLYDLLVSFGEKRISQMDYYYFNENGEYESQSFIYESEY